ncbi:hypothetical protein [Arsukibacterium indicum]|uniref:Uncharacterized protein n=1 Tax=Arsukibacterium indicum TaxID=2848612 RepID=A0ABS6MH93_9GAMM|nr:hypothetical protein [Arsukibacterium indicum]MBV2128180.1 hypothetical protein [Arsukibacterium indicum]
MTNEEIHEAAARFMEAASRQFDTNAELLHFSAAVAALSLGVMESIGGEAYLKQFCADATGPNRQRIAIERSGK